jgi:hypothetical protein
MLARPMPTTAAPTPTATGDTHALWFARRMSDAGNLTAPGSAAPGAFAASATPRLSSFNRPYIAVSAEDMDMQQPTRIAADRASLRQDEDGSRAARLLALSMGLLFSLIFVLQAYTW